MLVMIFIGGDITVSVLGDFGTLSVYCFNHGYMGGENLLAYSDSCAVPEPEPEPQNYLSLPQAPFTINNTTVTYSNINPSINVKVYINHSDINLDGNAYIQFNYIDGTTDEFIHRGTRWRQFYNPSTSQWSTYYGTDTNGNNSSSIMTWCNVSKSYIIKCLTTAGTSSWEFISLDTNLTSITLYDNASYTGMKDITISQYT